MAPILAPTFGVTFLKGRFSLKNGTFCPLLATIQPLSSARAFLYTQKKSRMICMGRTFTFVLPYLLIYCPNQLSFSWESNPARVEASGRGAKCYC
jgi:hypothetical protein